MTWQEAREQCWKWGGELALPLPQKDCSSKIYVYKKEEVRAMRCWKGVTTLFVTTLSITTFSMATIIVMILSITACSITTFSMTTIIIIILSIMTLSIIVNKTQHPA
jgi:hypothetical protein